jgi:tetratricopeptide (TPR) repeat protein
VKQAFVVSQGFCLPISLTKPIDTVSVCSLWRSALGTDRGKVLHNAQLFASRGQFDAAIAEWKKLTVESPADGSLHNSIGELHLKRNATTEAVAAFLQAANAFRTEGATLKAIATYKKILKIDSSRYEVYRHLGDLNAERGLLSSAVQDYLTLGKYYLKERKTKEALDIYKKIVSQDPSNLDAQQRVAELCLQENMQDEATKVYLQLGRERSAQQRYAEANDAYQAVLRIDPGNSEAIQFIENFEKGGDTRTTSPKPKTGQIAGASKNSEPLDMLAEATRRIDQKQFAGAEAILNQLLTREPGNPQVCQLLARMHLQRGDLHVALGEYRFLAGAALRAQDYSSAESLINEYLAVEPNSVPILELYGELYEEKGDASAAVAQYAKAVETLLKHPEPGMPTLHEEIFDRMKTLAPDSATVKRLTTLMQGETAADAASSESSSEASAPKAAPKASAGGVGTKESLWTGTEPDDLWKTASAIRISQDRHVETPASTKSKPDSPVVLDPAKSLTANAAPDAVRVPHSKGTARSTKEQFQAYMQAGEQAEAEQWLGHLVNEWPNDAEARELLGFLFEAKGDGPGAALQYGRALELLLEHPDNAKPERPAVLYAKVKELAPASPLVAKLASMFAPKSEEPVAVTTAAGNSTPVANGLDPDIHYTLGVAFKNMGLLDEAKEEFALSMKGNDLFLDSCLMTAVCLKEQGQGKAASAQLEQLVNDARCQGAKAQAIRYELGLLYEKQEQWQKAVAIFESIPTFHDVPKRLEALRGTHKPKPAAAGAFGYAT